MATNTDLERLFYGAKLGFTEDEIAKKTLNELRAAFVADVEVPGDPDNFVSGESNIARRNVNLSTVTSGTGVLRLSCFVARKTEMISRVRVLSGDVAAAATPTLCRIGVYIISDDGAATLVAATANDVTLFAAVHTPYTRNLTTSFKKIKGVRYGIGTLVVSGVTTPQLVGTATRLINGNEDILTELPVISAFLGAMTDLPASVPAATVVANGTPNAVFGHLLP